MSPKRKCPEGQIYLVSFGGCIEQIKEDDGITWEELCASIDRDQRQAQKVTSGLPGRHRRKSRGSKRKKKSTFEQGVHEAVREALLVEKI